MKTRFFSLVDLLVVVFILALVLAMCTPPMGGALEAARRGACKANLSGINKLASSYKLEMGHYPRSDRDNVDQAERYAKMLFQFPSANSKAFMCPSCLYEPEAVNIKRTTLLLSQEDVTDAAQKFRYDARLREIVDYAITQRDIPDTMIGTVAYAADGYRGVKAAGMEEREGHNHHYYGNATFLDGSAQAFGRADWYIHVAGKNALTDKDSGILLY